MQVELKIVNGSDVLSDALSLTDWLRREDELRGYMTIVPTMSASDEMGTLSDTMVVALSGGAGAALARSLPVWLRHRTSDVTVEITFSDGRTVKVDARRIADAEAVLRMLLDTTTTTTTTTDTAATNDDGGPGGVD